MKRIILYSLLTVFVCTGVVLAQDAVKDGNLDDLCKTIVNHVPDADVAYTGGYDVRGNPVAGADLPNENKIELPTEFAFPVTYDQIGALNIGGMLEGKMPIGVINVRGNRVYFNDKPIDGMEPDNLRVLCLKQH